MTTGEKFLELSTYQVSLKDITDEVLVYHYDLNFHYCLFNKNKANSFYDSYGSNGFIVSIKSGIEEFNVTGKFSIEDAKEMWTQIKTQISKPNFSFQISLPIHMFHLPSIE